ncbi:MAG: 6-phosphogluconolactonase [Gammaproteobacteria bacterium]
MKLEICTDADAAAERGAETMFDEIHVAIEARGRALIAVSGGHTPWAMLKSLGKRNLPWDRIVFFQVDERECSADDDSRNLKHLKEALPDLARIEAMPVEAGETGASDYAESLAAVAGKPPVLDVVHLGLGPDGHTASLVPGDPVLEVHDRDVAWTQPYQNHRRMTLTYPVLNRARLVFWLVAGEEKRDALGRLMAADQDIPAGRVQAAKRLVIADATAAGRSSL